MNVRTLALICALVSVVALLGVEGWKRHEASIDTARQQRVTATIDPAPAPLPAALPLTGSAGTDADGYPLRTVDRPALRSLLWHRRYRELSAYIEQFQSALEQDWRQEYWMVYAIGALSTREQEIEPALDAWVSATPESFAPWLARGAHRINAAYALRGVKVAKDTSERDFAAMREALTKGHSDLSQALAIHPRLVTALREQIFAHMAVRQDDERDVAFSKARIACPHCMQHRVAYLMTLRPRWGGGYDEMDAFAQREQDPENRRTRFLTGYADLDRMDELRRLKDTDGALALADNLCATGDYVPFLLDRAEVRMAREEWLLAQTDLDRALHLDPGDSDLLFERTIVALNTKQWEKAGADLLAGLRVDPAKRRAGEVLEYTMKRLVYEGGQLYKTGKRDEAIRLLDLAAELEPGNAELQQRRAFIVAGTAPSSDARQQADAKATAGPDDFDATRQLDYNLAAEGKFDQIIDMWSHFLAKHPDHARAHLERGGAYFRSGRRAEAAVDARRACELGLSEGCMRAKQLAGG
jgi:tetratricopeptide (TPR) repeat protein